MPTTAMPMPGYGAGPQAYGREDLSTSDDSEGGYLSLGKLKKFYLEYLSSKHAEIEEQKDARRRRHGSHWSAEQIAIFNKRKQPIVTYNRIGRKIDGNVGLVVRQRADPKAFPRTPQHAQGAELATAVLRYLFEEQDWDYKDPLCAERAATDGIAGIEFDLVPVAQPGGYGGQPGQMVGNEPMGPQASPGHDVTFTEVDVEDFFYDPRSSKADFRDARYLGTAKWLDLDTAKEVLPDLADELDGLGESGSDLTTNSDREQRWYDGDREGTGKRVRMVECWYKHQGKWCWCLFTGSRKFKEGHSPFYDKDQSTHKYEMFSAAVDHDNDRYGFVRNLKSANDEINMRRSKGLHELNSRRIIAEDGAFPDIEKARTEAARPDGVVVRNKGFEALFDDQAKLANIEGAFKFLEDAKAEIENFGPNPALIGQGLESRSGRAIQLMQQAGMADLGPFLNNYRAWKMRVYRKAWNCVQRYWTGERWVRVTDDQGLAQFIQINGVGIDPRTGMPVIENAIGSLDVDIILDEGPDQITLQQDVYETLQQVLPAVAPLLTPQKAQAAVDLLIETSMLPDAAKKKFRDAGQPDPQAQQEAQQVKQIQLADAVATVEETKSKTALNLAKAQAEGMPDMAAPQRPQQQELPLELQAAETMVGMQKTQAETALRAAQARKTATETSLLPMKAAHDQRMSLFDHVATQRNAEADREVQMRALRARQNGGGSNGNA